MAEQDKQAVSSFSGCLLRIFWMMLGNAALLMTLLPIVRDGGYTGYDIAFWTILALLILARFLDIRYYKGQTGTGEPATWSHFRSYVVTMLIIGIVLWGGAHAAGRFL